MQEATRKISLSILLPKIFVFRENKLFLAMIQKRMTSELARKIRFYILFRREVRQRVKKRGDRFARANEGKIYQDNFLHYLKNLIPVSYV